MTSRNPNQIIVSISKIIRKEDKKRIAKKKGGNIQASRIGARIPYSMHPSFITLYTYYIMQSINRSQPSERWPPIRETAQPSPAQPTSAFAKGKGQKKERCAADERVRLMGASQPIEPGQGVSMWWPVQSVQLNCLI